MGREASGWRLDLGFPASFLSFPSSCRPPLKLFSAFSGSARLLSFSAQLGSARLSSAQLDSAPAVHPSTPQPSPAPFVHGVRGRD